jgi:hypothetical protein
MNTQSPLSHLSALVEHIQPELTAQYIAEMLPMFKSIGHAQGPNPMSGSCLYLNYLLCNALKANGYSDAFIVGGAASFSFSKGDTGLVEYGRMNTFLHGHNADGSRFDGTAFAGHCWVEIPSLDVIVDASLAHLKGQVDTDNQLQGIHDEEFLLDPTKLVIEYHELHTREQLFNYEIGYSYVVTESITREAHSRLQFILDSLKRQKAMVA